MGFFSDLQLRLRDASSDAEATAIEREAFGESCGAAHSGIDIYALARRLRGEVRGNTILAPGPGHSSVDRSLSITFDASAPDGFIVYSFSGDDWQTYKDYVLAEIDEALRELFEGSLNRSLPLSIDEGLAELALPSTEPQTSWPSRSPSQSTQPSAEAKRAKALQLWDKGHASLCPNARRYLKSRGLIPEDHMIGRVFKYGHGYLPPPPESPNMKRMRPTDQLLAAVRDVETDELIGVHRTRLPHEGKGPDRYLLGTSKNGAIKLTSHEDVIAAGELTIGEGWETCLAAMMMGHKHVWSLCNANGIKFLPVIPGIRKLTILTENDAANEKARDHCADRWLSAGVEVIFDWPDEGFKDHADELFARRAAK